MPQGCSRESRLPTITAIYSAPVKSLALQVRDSVAVGPAGIAEDRRFHMIDGGGRLLTQRQRPQLSQVAASFDPESLQLSLTFPDGEVVSGPVEEGQAVSTPIFGRMVPGREAPGEWNEALSTLCGGPVRLVKTDQVGLSYDEYPLSLLSQASVDLLRPARRERPALRCKALQAQFPR